MLDRPICLSDVCAGSPLATKWLLAPSNRVGNQWVERQVRNGLSVINLHPATVIRIALDLVGCEFAVSGRTLASRDALELAIHAAWNDLPPDGYLRRLHRTDELSVAVLNSILALRMSGAETADIDGRMENAAKAKDLTVVATSYCKFLESHHLVDSAEVLKQAITRLGADRLALGPDTLILVPDGFTPTGLEGAFLAAVPAI